MTNDIRIIRKLDEELVVLIKDFLILGPLSWPKETMREFLAGAEQNNFHLPEVSYRKVSYKEKIYALKQYIRKLGKDQHPALNFLRDTAKSYLDAYHILQGIGTSDVSEFSLKLYGSPKDYLPGYKRRNVDVARYFLRVVEGYQTNESEEPLIFTASAFKRKLQRRVDSSVDLTRDQVSISIDGNITARATAGPNYVKIRKGAMFSEADLEQLLHHEVMIHTLTYINGRSQPVLKSLGYNAPRTTATQEGLAVFAEYINMSVDLVRLKRIALRILAIDLADRGADLIDLFQFYKLHGQNNEESYYSAMRIFRGGQPKGGIVFYKDNVYLQGMIEIEVFLKNAMHKGLLHHIPLLFAGKLTTQDVMRLQPLVEAGVVEEPKYLPKWAKRSSELAAHLAFNDLSERFKLLDAEDSKQSHAAADQAPPVTVKSKPKSTIAIK